MRRLRYVRGSQEESDLAFSEFRFKLRHWRGVLLHGFHIWRFIGELLLLPAPHLFREMCTLHLTCQFLVGIGGADARNPEASRDLIVRHWRTAAQHHKSRASRKRRSGKVKAPSRTNLRALAIKHKPGLFPHFRDSAAERARKTAILNRYIEDHKAELEEEAVQARARQRAQEPAGPATFPSWPMTKQETLGTHSSTTKALSCFMSLVQQIDHSKLRSRS